MMTMTRTEESTAVPSSVAPTLLLAFELGERTWKLGFSMGLGQRPRLRQIPAGATARLLDEIAAAKVRFKLPADALVVSCYEVGIPAGLRARLQRVWEQLDFLNTQLEELDAARAALAVDPQTTMGRYLPALPTIRGIGPVGTWTLTTELFGWR